MISIFSLYESFKGRVNAHQGGHIRPLDFVSWVQEIQMDIFNKGVAEFQKTQVISDEMTPFLESINIIVSNQAGQPWDLIVRPGGYLNYASARIIKSNGGSVGIKDVKEYVDGEEVENQCVSYIDPDELELIQKNSGSDKTEISIELIDNDRWAAVCNHPRKKLTCSSPKMTQYTKGWKIAPKGCANNVVMDFFRTPKKPVFNYTVINANAENEYYQFVSAGSVDLEWSEKMLSTFMSKLIDRFSIFVGDNELFNQSKVDQQQPK